MALISEQLDLAGGWRNAWRHELRGPHGEWIKSPLSAADTGIDKIADPLKPEGGSSDPRISHHDVSLAIIMQWNRQEPGPVKDILNQASAAWDAGDHPETIRLLLHAATEATKNDDALHSSMFRVMAARIRASDEAQADIERPIRAETAKASKVVHELISDGHDTNTGWNGSITTWPDDDLAHVAVAGEVGWDGTMGLQEQIAHDIDMDLKLRNEPVKNPRSWQVVLHELIHSVIPPGTSYDGGQAAYQQPAYAAIEEGFTEYGTDLLAPAFFEAMGIADRKTTETGFDIDPEHAAAHFDYNALIEHQQELRDLQREQGGLQYGAIDAYNGLGDAISEMFALGLPSGPRLAEDLSRAYSASLNAPNNKHGNRLIATKIKDFMDEIGLEPVGERQLTMGELARQRGSPAAINAGEAWGAYAGQTRAAQQFEQTVAMAEGYKDVRPGTRGHDRVVELANEVNRENPETKPFALATQIARANHADLSRQELNGLAWQIADDWQKAIKQGTNPYIAALTELNRYVAGHEGEAK